MPVPEWEEYLKKVLSHVRFKADRNPIYFELKAHMEDRLEEFLTEGMDEEQAKSSVLITMGDADEIGEEMNKAHDPVLGRIWWCLRTALILFIAVNILPVISMLVTGAISVFEGYNDITDSPLVYAIDVNIKEKVYDSTLIIDEIRYYEDETLEIRYATWTNPFADSIKWSTSIGTRLYDESGEELHAGWGGWKSGSYYGRGQRALYDVPLAAKTLVVTYGADTEFTIDITEGRVTAN